LHDSLCPYFTAGGGDGDLMALIQARQASRMSQADDLFAGLEVGTLNLSPKP